MYVAVGGLGRLQAKSNLRHSALDVATGTFQRLLCSVDMRHQITPFSFQSEGEQHMYCVGCRQTRRIDTRQTCMNEVWNTEITEV